MNKRNFSLTWLKHASNMWTIILTILLSIKGPRIVEVYGSVRSVSVYSSALVLTPFHRVVLSKCLSQRSQM